MRQAMQQLTRRKAISTSARVAAGVIGFLWSEGQSFLTTDAAEVRLDSHGMQLASDFMRKHNVPALSMTTAKNGQILEQQAFGVTDLETRHKLTPSNLFRIASISKSITSVGVFTLIEQGKLHLNDKIFGATGILGADFGGPPYRPYVEEITVDHLLTHTCGGWPGNEYDPLDRFPEMSAPQLISWTIANVALDHRPGEHWMYSNFGYVLLGRVIEKVSGKPYAEFVQHAVLTPCGATDMRISGNTKHDRAPNEVTYYSQDDADPYQGNHHRADASGGWIATSTDLVRFGSKVRGFPQGNAILKNGIVAMMTAPCPIHPSYARGWDVDQSGNWWHSGGMPGTSSVMVTTPTGLCWAALTNTSRASVEINHDLDALMRDLVRRLA
jgi:CubicO group peptidase (beta-lactamase class C family)